MTNTHFQQITVKAIITKDSKILFLKDLKGKWELPGGRLEFDEKPEEALVREIREELGFTQVEIERIIHAWTFSVTVDVVDKQFIVLVYKCVVHDTQDIIANNEYLEHAWVSLGEVKDLLMQDGYKESVEKYLAP